MVDQHLQDRRQHVVWHRFGMVLVVVGSILLLSNESLVHKYFFETSTENKVVVTVQETTPLLRPMNHHSTNAKIRPVTHNASIIFQRTAPVASPTKNWNNALRFQNIESTSDTILQRMNQSQDLPLSIRQQISFQGKRHELSRIFPFPRRRSVNAADWAANVVNEQYVFLHIYKNGGTTVAAQTRHGHVPLRKVVKSGNYRWFAVVRDPLEHFLSGWSECGHRQRKGRRKKAGLPPDGPMDWNETIRAPSLLLDYDTRIAQWLDEVETKSKSAWTCAMHGFPQVNYMLTKFTGEIFSQLEFIGDLQELPAILEVMVGFPYNATIATGRNASSDAFLRHYYPRRIDWLGNTTLRRLCDFLAIDYYLLDYPLPDACRDMPVAGYSNWT